MEVSNLWRVHASKPQGDVLGFVDNIRIMSMYGYYVEMLLLLH